MLAVLLLLCPVIGCSQTPAAYPPPPSETILRDRDGYENKDALQQAVGALIGIGIANAVATPRP